MLTYGKRCAVEQVFRQTCVLRGAATSFDSDGSRLEVIEMEDRRQTSSPQVPARRGPPSPPVLVTSKSQLIVHCDSASAGHNNGIRSTTATRDVTMLEVL